MKLILEGASLLSGSFEDELNEASGQSERNYYISGIFSTPEAKNRNGRVYSRSIWEREVAKYQKEITERSANTLGEWQHPPRSTVDPLKAVLRIVELRIDETGNVVGKAKILNDNTEQTNKLKGLIKEGIKIGVSSRGVGKVSATGVVEDFKLITYDAVDMPSDYNAMLNGVVEGYTFENGVMLDKEYSVDENGCIGEVCGLGLTNENTSTTTEKCPIQEKIEEAVQNAKKEIYDNIDSYLIELMKEVTAKNTALVENIDLYFKENNIVKSDEEVIEVTNTVVDSAGIDEAKAKALIQALNNMSEGNKLDSELETLVKIKKISREDLDSALEYSLTLAENDDDVKEWEKDMKEAFPEMDSAVLSKLKDKFLGR